MAVPKKKRSKCRTGRQKSENMKIKKDINISKGSGRKVRHAFVKASKKM